MHRFLVKNIDFKKEIILKDKEIIFQLGKVLRIPTGKDIVLFNGEENIDCIYIVINIDKYSISLKLKEIIEKKSELEFNLVLYQALPNKISKLEYILQKATEVGFKEIIFFKSERSQKLNITDNKIKRFNKIILEALEQSSRNILPTIKYLNKLNLSILTGEKLLLHHENSNNTFFLKELKVNYKKNINIFIGPEGGFSDNEVETFLKFKSKKIYLGDRILRTETAGVVVGFFISQNF